MRVLEFRAIDLDYRAGVPKQDFRSCFHDARLSRSCRPQKKQVSHRTAGRVQSGAKDLKHVYEGLHAFFLTDDLGPQGSVKITSVIAADGWIQLMADGSFHFISPSSRLAPQTRRASQSRASLSHCMGVANLFHSLDG